jgi:hypothetical protein
MIARTSPLNLVLMIAGFVLWGIAFNALYGANSLGCELAWHRVALGPSSLQRIALIGLWITLLALHVWLLAWLWRRLADTPQHPRLDRFIQFASVATAGLGLTATLVTGAPVAVLSPCAV